MLVAEVIKLVKLILVVPATNGVRERWFSSLKRIKTNLPSTTANNRLKHHIHQKLTEDSILPKLLTTSLKEEKKENQDLDFDSITVDLDFLLQ